MRHLFSKCTSPSKDTRHQKIKSQSPRLPHTIRIGDHHLETAERFESDDTDAVDLQTVL